MIKASSSIGKILTYSYAFLTGTSFLFSFANAGEVDKVIINLNDTLQCTKCTSCPVHATIGGCDEDFPVKPFFNKNVSSYLSQYSGFHKLDSLTIANLNRSKIFIPIFYEAPLSSKRINIPSSLKKVCDASSKNWQSSTNLLEHVCKGSSKEDNRLGLNFVDYLWRNKSFVSTSMSPLSSWHYPHKSEFTSSSQELNLDYSTVSYLYSLFS